jgi:L-gulonate 5-dehydrogenase
MIRAVTADPRTVRIDSGTGMPAAAAGEVVVAVERVGVCGSDAHVYEGTHPYLGYPQVQGHEVVGRVVQTGEGVSESLLGERVVIEPTVPCGRCVACRRGSPNCCVRLDVLGITLPGGLSEAIAVPCAMVHPVGALPADVAVFVEPLAVAVHAVKRAGVGPGDDVVVIGAGSIGRSIVFAARDAGARVLVVERTPERAALVRRIGVAVCGSEDGEFRQAVAAFSGVDGPGVVIDATGSGELVRTALDLVAHSGVVVVVGISQDDLVVPIAMLTRKEVALLGSRNSERDFPHAIDVARRNADELLGMITERLPLEQTEAAFRSVLDRTSFGKVLVVLDDLD